ncbi:hypothetical protein Bca101_070574 [Brassica carinata]
MAPLSRATSLLFIREARHRRTWFGTDPEVHALIRATWQGNYWGSWASWNFVPPEKKDQWWHAFIQHYYWEDQFHDEIYLKWKKQTQVTVCGRISQNRRDNRQPSYMSDTHWATMVEKYSTEQAKKKSAKAVKSRKSASDGKKMHKHGAGPRCFLNIEYKMMVDEGLDEPPSYTALARKTHTGKDGSFLDERTEELVLEFEEAIEEMLQDGSPLGDIQTDSTAASNSKRYLLNQEYIKRKDKKGYSLRPWQLFDKNKEGFVQFSSHSSATRRGYAHVRFETTISEVKEDIARVKEDFSALKTRSMLSRLKSRGGCQQAKQLSTLFCKLSNLKLPLLPQLHNHFSLKLSHNLKVSPKLQFNLNISHNLKLSLRLYHNISRPITNLIYIGGAKNLIINGRWTSTNETDAFDSNRVKMEKYCKEEDTRAVHARKQSDPLVTIRI